MIYNFYVSSIVDLLKECPVANISNAFLFDMALLKFSGYFLLLNSLC